MYRSVGTNGAMCLYSGGRRCSNGGRLNSGGGVLTAAWSQTSQQSGCGTVRSTAEAPTDSCIKLIMVDVLRIVMLYEGGSYCK